MTTQYELTEQLCDITRSWTDWEDIPPAQAAECKNIGVALNELGGMDAMQNAFYEAKGRNRAASTVQAFWHGVGNWQW